MLVGDSPLPNSPCRLICVADPTESEIIFDPNEKSVFLLRYRESWVDPASAPASSTNLKHQCAMISRKKTSTPSATSSVKSTSTGQHTSEENCQKRNCSYVKQQGSSEKSVSGLRSS